jgi:hypothetical protein
MTVSFKTGEDMMRRLKDLLILYDKVNHPGIGLILGASGATDAQTAVSISIAEHLLLFHSMVEDGLFPEVEPLEMNHQKISLTPDQRKFFQKIYAACHPSTSHRLTQGFLTHAAFLPTKKECKEIHNALGLEPDAPDVVICTYKNTEMLEEK